eukprot:GEMP01128106.1.p1 GENE.GEMP01128106.1~~GEMP01128106.1.p1  ORF type:complete len:103 (+),score=23.22 GEMP01128106.1:114-422(+)
MIEYCQCGVSVRAAAMWRGSPMCSDCWRKVDEPWSPIWMLGGAVTALFFWKRSTAPNLDYEPPTPSELPPDVKYEGVPLPHAAGDAIHSHGMLPFQHWLPHF